MAARDLDNDPEQLSLNVIPLLRYEEAYRAWRRAKPDELKAWGESEVMEAVKSNDFAAAERALAAPADEAEA